MAGSSVWFWRGVLPLVRGLKRSGFPLNRAVNEALLLWFGVNGDEELRLRAKLVLLRSQEAELRQTMRVMLRSGSYLPQYADKLFREKYGSSEPSLVRRGQVPLRALSPKEEDVARRVLAERERIAQEIADVLDKLLPKKKFRLKPSPRPRRRRSQSRHTLRHARETTNKEE
jgi:hypothetical protein